MAEQTLRPYNPSWADKLAAHLYDMTSKSPEARNFVGGLMGGTGLGRTQMGLVDAVPVAGQALQAQEAYTNNDPKGMAMAMLPLAPAAKQGANYAGALGRMARNEDGWIAWHGSPHKFDQFDASKIGTGEGAQAYGHGLYFAEAPAVAQQYANALGGRIPDEVHSALRGVDNLGFNDAGTAIANIRKHPDWMKRWDVDPARSQTEADAVQAIRQHIDGNDRSYMYRVDISPDQSQFLDWDKPLSEQHPNVQAAIHQDRIFDPTMNGAEFYNDKAAKLRRNAIDADTRPDVLAARTLREAGIPGIKYLDQGSRGAGNGTSNFVVFNPNDVQILERNGVRLGMPPVRR